jgi:hypothetical protein
MSLILTRQGVKQRANRVCFNLAEAAQHEGAMVRFASGNLDPFTQDEDLEGVMDELVRTNDTHYLTYENDLVAGTARYCAPELYYIEKVILTRPDGLQKKPLVEYRTDQMPWAYPERDVDPQAGEPMAWMAEGLGAIVVYPIPDYDMPRGVEMSGLGTYEPTAWANPDSIGPLPHRYHITVADGLALRQLKGYGNQLDKSDLVMEWRRGKGALEAESMTYTARIKARTRVITNDWRRNVWRTRESNPLDL